MKKITLIALLIFIAPAAFGQVGRATRTVTSDPTGVACTASSPVLHYNGGRYTCESGAYAQTSEKRAAYAIASLPTCNASRVNVTVNVTDSDRIPRRCLNTTGGNYAWVRERDYILASDFGVSPTETDANNVTYLENAIAAAQVYTPVIEISEGTYNFNSEINIPGGVTLRGRGVDKTVLQYTAATGAFLRAVDYAVAQSYTRVESLRINATGSAINANTVGVDMSSMNHSITRSVTVFNFGTQFLMDGYRSGGLVSTYYNTLYDCKAAMGSAGNVFTSKGIAIQGGANSNNVFRPRFSYLTYPLAIGDSADDPPNQISINDPVIEQWEGTAVYIPKGLGIHIQGGRYEGDGSNAKIFDVDDDTSNVSGVIIDLPYLEPNSAVTVLDTNNPTVSLRGGNYRSYVTRQVGLSTDKGANLIQNGGFEGWPPGSNYPLLGWSNVNGTNWSHSSIYITRSSSPVKTGTYAIRIGDATNTNIGVRTASIAIDPTRPYTLDWWSRGTTTDVGYRIAFKIFDSSGVEITSSWAAKLEGVGENASGGTSGIAYLAGNAAWVLGSDLTHAIADTWYRRSFSFYFPANAASVQIGFILTATPLQYVYIDNVQLVQGEAALGFQAKKLDESGDNNFYGTLTLPKLKTADPFQGNGSLEISVTGAASQIKEANSNRIYYDAFNHIWRRENSSTFLARFTEDGVLALGGTLFSEDTGIYRSGTGRLRVTDGGASNARDLEVRYPYVFGAGAGGANYFRFVGTPTGSRDITIPDASLTMARTDAAQTFTGDQTFAGDVISSTAGKSLQIKTGTNACAGVATLVAGTATVSTTCTGTLGTNRVVILTPVGASTGAVRVSASTNDTSFTITSSDGASTDAIHWVLLKIN